MAACACCNPPCTPSSALLLPPQMLTSFPLFQRLRKASPSAYLGIAFPRRGFGRERSGRWEAMRGPGPAAADSGGRSQESHAGTRVSVRSHPHVGRPARFTVSFHGTLSHSFWYDGSCHTCSFCGSQVYFSYLSRHPTYGEPLCFDRRLFPRSGSPAYHATACFVADAVRVRSLVASWNANIGASQACPAWRVGHVTPALGSGRTSRHLWPHPAESQPCILGTGKVSV